MDGVERNHDSRQEMRAPFRYRFFARAWALSALAHLTLPDALQWSWLVPDLFLGAGALGLAVRPQMPPAAWGIACWSAAVVGLAWPLLLEGDQLTQSGYMLAGALAAIACGRPDDDRALALAIRVLTTLVYGAAFFHKINADFFDPAVSCATGGMHVLAANWSLPLAPAALDSVWPALFLGTEGLLVALFIARPRWAIALALVMHIPLTIIFAPSFGWVMASGWVCFLREAELQRIAHVWRRRWRAILALGLTLGFASAALYFRDHWVPYPLWQIKELGLWVLLVAYGFSLRGGADRGAWSEAGPRGPRAVAWALCALFCFNALTPYLGIQFHHAGAMLSNLRVDRGCWNHLLIPEAIRVREPYVRVDDVDIGGAIAGPGELTEHLRVRLWHPADLRAATQRYCDAGAGPLRLGGRFGEIAWTTRDACVALPIPSQRAGLFQTNLERECPQRCLH